MEEVGLQYNAHLMSGVSGNLIDILSFNYGKTEEKIRKRMDQAKAEIGRAGEFEYLVTNKDIDTAAREIVAIITAEKLKASKNIDTAKALL